MKLEGKKTYFKRRKVDDVRHAADTRGVGRKLDAFGRTFNLDGTDESIVVRGIVHDDAENLKRC